MVRYDGVRRGAVVMVVGLCGIACGVSDGSLLWQEWEWQVVKST